MDTDLDNSNQENEPIDHVKSSVLRVLLIGVGSLALVVGLIGIVLPVLPTTPFLLVSAACYARSSNRFYMALLNNPYFGPYIRAWRLEHRIPLRAKILAVIMIVVTIGASIVFVIPVTAVKLLLAAIGLTVILYICHFPN